MLPLKLIRQSLSHSIYWGILFGLLALSGCGGGGSAPAPTPLSSAKAITSFSILNPAASGTINESAKTIALKLLLTAYLAPARGDYPSMDLSPLFDYHARLSKGGMQPV